MLAITDDDPGTPERIAGAVASDKAQGVLTTNSIGGLAAAEALPDGGQDRHLRPRAGRAQSRPGGPDRLRGGPAALPQGYLPIEMLALRARYGIFPSQGDVVATGPNFVTRGDAAQALELSERSIR